MGRVLVAILVLIGAVVGIASSLCLGSTPVNPSASAPPSPEIRRTPDLPPIPKRSAPEKVLNAPTPCSIVDIEDAQRLGADRPPRERTSNGKLGCDYEKDIGFDGFKVFISHGENAPTAAEYDADQHGRLEKMNFAGHPAARKHTDNGVNCITVIDISDHESLFFNTLVGHPGQMGYTSSELTDRFARKALEKLPDA